MNLLGLVVFALWALCMRYLPHILEFIKRLRFAETIPGPTVAELIENAKKDQMLSWLCSLRKKYGPVFRIWFGKDLMVFFTDPEDIRQILTMNSLLLKTRNYEIIEPWLGKGLLTSEGAAWQRRRKLLTPAFHFRILSQFKEPLEENCKILINKLHEKADGQPFDVYPYLALFALDAICETAMGITKNAQLHSDSEYVRAAQEMSHITHKQSFSFWQRLNIFYRYTDAGRERDAKLKVLHGETDRVIKERRALLKETDISDVEELDDLGTRKRRLAFLDILLLSQMEGNGLTDREIREEVDTFMFAGHDTTSSTISFVTYVLSKHPEVQQKAYEEVMALKGHEKESMPYLEAVIKETLRIYAAAPLFSRKAHEDLTIGNITIPKGTAIGIPAYLVHREEKYFPEPEKFNPERFLDSEKNLHPFAYIAFSAGPRNCIGQRFALLEIKCCVSYLLRNFEFLPVENFEPQLVTQIIIKSSNGVKIRIRPRK